MIINRHNYEDYFILYLDNELDAKGKMAVEEFLASNPDLQSEMDSFRQTILVPDDALVFDQKEMLLVNDNPINIHNYTGYLVAYMDNELQPADASALEQYLVTHPEAAGELQLLQRARLHADETVVFADKEGLYRYSDVHNIKPAAWWRAAAAAVIVLGLGAGGFLLSEDQQDIADPVIAKQVVTEPIKQADVKSGRQIENTSPATVADGKQLRATDKTSIQQPVLYAHTITTNQVTDNNKKVATPDQQELEKPIGMPVSTTDITPGDQNIYTELQQQNINDVAVTNEINTAYYPKASNETNQLMYAADLEQDNKKIRGFFRKATRIIERTTNISATNEDDKLLLGAFAISLK